MAAIAMDLGTTNSCIASHDGVQPNVILTPERQRYMPSAIWIGPDDKPLVGVPAITAGKREPERLFRYWKLLLGLPWNDDEDTDSITGRRTCRGPDGMTAFVAPEGMRPIRLRSGIVTPIEGGILPAPHLSAILIEHLLDCAEHALEEGRPDRAVITVPASFGETQKASVIEAGRLAGLSDVRLLHEPTAAALAYSAQLRERAERGDKQANKIRRVVVYDIGGGTFDVSVVRVGRSLNDVLSNGGKILGGRDFDRKMIDIIVSAHREGGGADLQNDSGAMARVRDAAEQAKIDLSTHTNAIVHEPLIESFPPRDLRVIVDRAQLEQATQALRADTLQTCREVMRQAGLTPSDLGDIILVGGQTLMPAIYEDVKGYFGREPKDTINPNEVVALGAATLAALWDSRIVDMTLSDRLSHSVGIRAHGDIFSLIVPRGALFPTRKIVDITVAEDGQEGMTLEVFTGDSTVATRNTALTQHTIMLGHNERGARGEVVREYDFDVDGNGLLTIRHDGEIIYSGAPHLEAPSEESGAADDSDGGGADRFEATSV